MCDNNNVDRSSSSSRGSSSSSSSSNTSSNATVAASDLRGEAGAAGAARAAGAWPNTISITVNSINMCISNSINNDSNADISTNGNNADNIM